MYTVYFILVIVIIVSFITGNIVLFAEHKLNKKEKTKPKKETIKSQTKLKKSVVLDNTIITTAKLSKEDNNFFDEPILIPLEIADGKDLIIDEELI